MQTGPLWEREIEGDGALTVRLALQDVGDGEVRRAHDVALPAKPRPTVALIWYT